MHKMKLIVNDFEEYRDQFSLWSTIFVQIGELCYPCDGWTDATSAILEMWTNSINAIITDTKSSENIYFMDGGYAIRLTKHGDTTAEAHFLNQKGEVFSAQTIDLIYFARQLLAAAGKMTQYYWNHLECPQIKRVLQAAEHLRHTIQNDK